jgi:hypothetical protein
MFRTIIRTGVLAAALGAALAFSGSALAGPTTPNLNPIPPTVFAGQLTISWLPSTFDPGALLKQYRVDVVDKPPNVNAVLLPPILTAATQTTLNVQAGHTYVVRVRAFEITQNFDVVVSAADWDSFLVLPQITFPNYYEIYFEFPPDPWCLTCPPLWEYLQDDPVVQRNRDRLASARVYEREVVSAVHVDARGLVTPIYER